MEEHYPAGLMSFNAQQAYSFFAPLKGKTSTFLVEERQTNLSFAKTIASLLAVSGDGCFILDVDAFYSSNADLILAGLPAVAASSILAHVPEPRSRMETEFPVLFRTDSRVILVDNLNSLHHLLSSADARSGSRKLAFAVASLSYLARADKKAVLFSMYRRDRTMRTGGGRSISGLSDLTISVGTQDSELVMECERGAAWSEGRFSIRIP